MTILIALSSSFDYFKVYSKNSQAKRMNFGLNFILKTLRLSQPRLDIELIDAKCVDGGECTHLSRIE
jgi:hypothetical protein